MPRRNRPSAAQEPRQNQPHPGTPPRADRTPGRTGGALLPLLVAASLFAGGCSGDSASPVPAPVPPTCAEPELYRFSFQLEYRTPGTLEIERCGTALEGTLVLEKDFGVLRAGVPCAGTGTVFPFPETGRLLYTWTCPVPDVAPGTCPEERATLALSLYAPEGRQTLSGGLTAYCGDASLGVRPLKVMRLSGPLERAGEPQPAASPGSR